MLTPQASQGVHLVLQLIAHIRPKPHRSAPGAAAYSAHLRNRVTAGLKQKPCDLYDAHAALAAAAGCNSGWPRCPPPVLCWFLRWIKLPAFIESGGCCQTFTPGPHSLSPVPLGSLRCTGADRPPPRGPTSGSAAAEGAAAAPAYGQPGFERGRGSPGPGRVRPWGDM